MTPCPCGKPPHPGDPSGRCPECLCAAVGHLYLSADCCRCGKPSWPGAGFAPPAAAVNQEVES